MPTRTLPCPDCARKFATAEALARRESRAMSRVRTVDFERLITSVPLDRTAAVVAGATNQDDNETPETRRANLVKLVHQIDRAIQTCKADPERKRWLGLRKHDVEQLIRAAPVKPRKGRNLSNFIVDVVKEQMTKAQFALVVEEADRRFLAQADEDS
jgi:hypothetical protein